MTVQFRLISLIIEAAKGDQSQKREPDPKILDQQNLVGRLRGNAFEWRGYSAY
ncbi:hypothetical protein D3C87_214440 [compost metagenome]